MKTFASFDGTRIAFSDLGNGPAVILLHGYGFDGLGQFGDFDRNVRMFEKSRQLFTETFGGAPPMPVPPEVGRTGLIPRLIDAGFRAIVPDLRGFGASDKPADRDAYANSAMSRDVIALIEHLRLESASVVGFSMGAGVATRLLVLNPPQVRTAILGGIGDYILRGEPLELPARWPIPEHLPKPLTHEVWAEHGAQALDRGELVKGDLASAHVIAARVLGTDPKVLASVVRGAVGKTVPAEALRDTTARVMVLNGTADVANQKAAKLVAAIPGAVAAVCDGDHGSTPWQPTFQQVVVDFLRG